ncbi:MAG TPA: ABC transporter ATP-binding protein [Phototrophicaceae bacterium]|nr:ABC transporter ATP-binding protein [Phototrophicaceae bacterium]
MTAALEVRDLRVRIGSAAIVGGVSWAVEPGQTLGIVGESGSGKSMSVLAATGLVGPPTAQVSGQVLLGDADGGTQDLLTLPREALRRVRGRRIGFVFQDPATSLNPVLTVERQLTEGLEEHLNMTRRAATARAVELLELVGIPDPHRRLGSYPHELSGGMRQRVMIAIALACEPQVVIADEATTALDVTIQAQILDAVRDLQERLGTATVWISHDLAVVGGLADEVAVMYGGLVLEQADVLTLFRERAHPYTDGLFAARPRLGAHETELVTIPGSPPDPRALPPGCVFWDRCTVRGDERCASQRPDLREVAPGHLVRSFYTREQS